MGKLVRKLFLLKPDDGVHSHATERRMRGELVGVGDGLNMRIKKEQSMVSLVIQQLRLHALQCRGSKLDPWPGN